RVPAFVHMSRAAALTAARRAQVKLRVGQRYAAAAAGTVIGQAPRARSRVLKDSAVQLTLSRGPAPVSTPSVTRESFAAAQRSLASLLLHVAARFVPAPGSPPGTVVAQTPAADHSTPAGSTVHLSVAETPQWRPLTTFATGSSGPFRIIGQHWRVVYSMGFQGTCNWIFWCSGPTARVIDAATGRAVAGFGLSNGSDQSHTFAAGPGTYEIQVTPGGDDARWSVRIDDDY
ncbi:MAG TPA: PASTA domain-containing protein, partial [Solirubrobacteraceae bacterium]